MRENKQSGQTFVIRFQTLMCNIFFENIELAKRAPSQNPILIDLFPNSNQVKVLGYVMLQ